MAHVYNGSYGTFSDLSDAIAWAHFKHDKLNNTYICLDDGTIIYSIVPTSDTGNFTEGYQELLKNRPWIEWDTKPYKIARVK